MKSKDPQEIKPKHWYEMGLSDMPQKQPVVTWILRIVVGTALGSTLALILTIPNLPQFKSRAQLDPNNFDTSQSAPAASLFLAPADGDFKIGDIFSVDVQLNTDGSNVVAVAAYLRYDAAKLEALSIDSSSSVFSYEMENEIQAGEGRILITRGQPTPGVSGPMLQVARVNFKGLAAASASAVTLDFTGVDANGDSGAILDDGLGSDVLNSVSNGSYNISALACTENWTCGDWSACENGERTRVCADATQCGTANQKPSEKQTCQLPPPCTENWTCGDWSACANSEQTRACADQTQCGTEENKPAAARQCVSEEPVNQNQNSNQNQNQNSNSNVTEPSGGDEDDTVAPNTTITSGPTRPMHTKTANIAWSGVDDRTPLDSLQFSFRLDEGEWSPFQILKEKAFSDLYSGWHIIEVRARDESENIDPTPAKIIFVVDLDTGAIIGPASGKEPQITLLDQNGNVRKQFLAYEKGFAGGVSFAAKDMGDDGVREIITGPGKGREPEVRLFRMNGSRIDQFLAYSKNFKGGVNVAAGDLDGDGNKEIITAPQSGIQKIKVFKFQKGKWTSVKWDFYPYSFSMRIGTNIAIGDFDGDGKDEIAAAPSIGGSAVLKIFGLRNGKIKSLTPQIRTFTKNFKGGAHIASGDLNADGKDDIVVSVASKGGPQVLSFGINRQGKYGLLSPGFFAFDKNMKNGVAVGVSDIDGDGQGEILASLAGQGKPRVRVFSSDGKTKIKELRDLPFASSSGSRIGKW